MRWRSHLMGYLNIYVGEDVILKILGDVCEEIYRELLKLNEEGNLKIASTINGWEELIGRYTLVHGEKGR